MAILAHLSHRVSLLWLLASLLPLGACASSPESSSSEDEGPLVATTPANYTYRIVNIYPHDPTAFTQGLIFVEGMLYEGTGIKGQSSLRKVDLHSGQVLQQADLPAGFFGEGITLLGQRLIQLTWQAQIGLVYDWETFAELSRFTYPTEGWGITHDGRQLIMSDGTAMLRFWDPETFAETGRIEVRAGEIPVPRLNELEYVEGEIFANIWQTDRIARIDPQDGQVLGWIDLTGLLTPQDRRQRVDVLNGIAYDEANKRLFVTGKWWPKLFEIELVPQAGGQREG